MTGSAFLASRRKILALIFLAVLPATSAGAATDLNEEMKKVAEQIKLLLDQKGFAAIAIGEFRGPAKLASSSGPAIAKALGDELKKIGVEDKRSAALEVHGEYRAVKDKKTNSLCVAITAQVVDQTTGDKVADFDPRGIFNIREIALLTGVTAAIPADAPPEARREKIEKAMDKPNVHLDPANTRVSAEPGSPYAVEILVKAEAGSDYLPRAATKGDDGFAFLKIKRGESYEVRLINDSPHDAAVSLTIDGLSVFAFSENTGYTHWIVPKKGSLTVPGWHRTNTLSDTFLVTEYAKSAVARKLPGSSTIGTITAGFSAAWPPGTPRPDDEPKDNTQGSGKDASATGFGPPAKTDFVDAVREVGRLRASVSVHYTKEGDPKNLPDTKP